MPKPIFYLQDKERIKKLFILHVLATTSLIIIGEYTFSIALQFVFLLSVLKSKNIFTCIYFLSIHYTLLLLFASNSFILYFLLLCITVTFIFIEALFLKKDEIFICMAVVGTLVAFWYIKAEESIYDLYIWLDVTDEIHYLNSEVIVILSFVHVAIIVFIINKKKKISYF